jgi:penicillin-binding protein 1A
MKLRGEEQRPYEGPAPVRSQAQLEHPWVSRLREVRRSPFQLAFAAGLVLVSLPVLAGGFGLAAFLVFPPTVNIPEPKPDVLAATSHVYAADGSLLATFHSEHNREPISIDQMPEHLQEAAIAAEDERFYAHAGVDVKAIFRALLADIQAQEVVQGGSTITQQYVKQAYVGSEVTILRKVREALVAAEVERTYSKRKILERYLNTVYFGQGAYGVEAASQTFFGKPASEISVSEAALLTGVIANPGRFSPHRHPSDAEIRRRYVLERMEKIGHLTSAQAFQAIQDRPVLVPPKEEVLRFPWFVDAVRRYLIDRYGEARVFAGGLEVTTTLDPKMQEMAEKVIAETLPSPNDPYASLVTIDPRTGYVRALVGGRDYEKEKFNIAIQGRRQPGSAFKPFVLVGALEQGIPPGKRYRGPSTICLKEWKPTCKVSNFDGDGFGSITVERATINSVNTVYAQMVLDVGPGNVVDVAKRMGIPGPAWMPSRSGCKASRGECRTQIEAVPSLALGAEEVTPLEMASAFATLAASGNYQEPKLVSRVVDESGKVLESGPSQPVQAMEPAVADTSSKILEQVITRGTGRRADIGRPAAGKTGTAQDFRNAWFVGYTPDLSTAVWMGYRDRNKEMFGVHGVARVTGGSLPAQIWGQYMKQALADIPPAPFPEPGELPQRDSFQLPHRPPPSPVAPAETPETPEEEPSPSPTPKEIIEPSPDGCFFVLCPPEEGDSNPSPSPSPKQSPSPSPVEPSVSPPPEGDSPGSRRANRAQRNGRERE